MRTLVPKACVRMQDSGSAGPAFETVADEVGPADPIIALVISQLSKSSLAGNLAVRYHFSKRTRLAQIKKHRARHLPVRIVRPYVPRSSGPLR
jgi:hypothetical protein